MEVYNFRTKNKGIYDIKILKGYLMKNYNKYPKGFND